MINIIKNLTAILPFITLSAYSVAFVVLAFYLSDVGMPYSVITGLTVSDYVVLFVMVSVISIYITFIFYQPLMVLTELYQNEMSIEYNAIDLGVLDRLNSKLALLMSNKANFFLNSAFVNVVFAFIACLILADYLKWAGWWILIVFFVFKYFIDFLFSLAPKVLSFIVLILVLLLIIYKAAFLVRACGYGNVDKYIITSKKPDAVISNIINFQNISSPGSKIYSTHRKIHLALITKDSFYIKTNNTSGKDYIKLPSDVYTAFDNLCNMCHSKL